MRGMPRRGRSGGKGEESPSQPRRGRSGGKGEESPSQPRRGRSGGKGEESPSQPRLGRSGRKGEESPSQPRRGRSGGKGEESPSQPHLGRSGRKGEESPSRPCTLRGDEADVVPGSAEKAQAMMDETQATTSTNTLTPLEDLEKRIRELRMQKKAILRAREQAKAVVTKLIDRNLVIPFVEELEEAHQYYDFKEYIKGNLDIKVDNSAESIYHSLVESEVRKERFKKVNDEAIRIAINARFSEIKADEQVKSWYAYTNWLISCKSITSDSDLAKDMETVHSVDNCFPGLSCDEKTWELNNYKLFLSLWVYSKEDKVEKFREKFKKEYDRALAKLSEEYDYYAAVDLIYDLVFKARQAKYVMDENPERQIEQIIGSRPSTYFNMVKKFKEMMISGHSPRVRNHDVCDIRVSVDDEEPTLENVEKFISSMHDKALEKYKHLRSIDTIVEAKGIITGTLDKAKDTEPESKPSRKRKISN